MLSILESRLITAIVTPFTDADALDVPALERLISHLIANKTDALVLAGTTGEGSALSLDEKKTLLKTAQAVTAGRNIPLIFATGTNNTRTSIELSKQMADAGADALLVVCPYYVKPSQEGLYQHFVAVAKAVNPTPITIYNIPGRTSVTMTPATMARLAKDCPNIVGVKQSLADMDAVTEIKQLCPQNFQIWSGDDSLTLPMMALGAIGVISVASHLYGPEMAALIEAITLNDLKTAQAYHQKVYPAIKALFSHPNPMVVKACLHEMGLIGPALRLPMLPLNASEKAELKPLFSSLPKANQPVLTSP